MSKPSWISEWPTLKSKNDLRGVSLGVFENSPPEPTTKKGMSTLVVQNNVGQKFSVLVTQQDIQAIIDIVTKGKSFTFDQEEPWANVVEFEGEILKA